MRALLLTAMAIGFTLSGCAWELNRGQIRSQGGAAMGGPSAGGGGGAMAEASAASGGGGGARPEPAREPAGKGAGGCH